LGFENDTIIFGSSPRLVHFRPLWLDAQDRTERLLSFPVGPDVLLDVQRAQYAKKVTSLDFVIQDDTTVDYIKLTLVY